MNIKYFRSFTYSMAVLDLPLTYGYSNKWSTMRPNIIQYNCHYHLVYFLVYCHSVL